MLAIDKENSKAAMRTKYILHLQKLDLNKELCHGIVSWNNKINLLDYSDIAYKCTFY